MTKDEREKLREQCETALQTIQPESFWKPMLDTLDYCDKLERDYADHMVVYEALLDEQKKTEELEERVGKLEEFVRQVDGHTTEYAGVAGNGELYALVQALAQGGEK
jgi:hypothetical protein